MEQDFPTTPNVPGFPEVRQIGIAVKSIDRAIAYYARSFGIGPWFKPKLSTKEHRLKGTEVISDETEIAIAFSGKIQLELIELISGSQSIYREHLEKHGEGIHHLGFNIRMSRPWFELGCITGDIERFLPLAPAAFRIHPELPPTLQAIPLRQAVHKWSISSGCRRKTAVSRSIPSCLPQYDRSREPAPG